jgi:hypothetical protein
LEHEAEEFVREEGRVEQLPVGSASSQGVGVEKQVARGLKPTRNDKLFFCLERN